MKGTVSYNELSESFIISGEKQGCALTPTLFGIFLSMSLKHALENCKEGFYIQTGSGGRLFNLAREHAKSKNFQMM